MSATSVPAASAAGVHGGQGGGGRASSSSQVHPAAAASRHMTSRPSHPPAHVATADVPRPVFEGFGLLQHDKRSLRTMVQTQVDKITRALNELALAALPAAAAFATTELPSATLSPEERLLDVWLRKDEFHPKVGMCQCAHACAMRSYMLCWRFLFGPSVLGYTEPWRFAFCMCRCGSRAGATIALSTYLQQWILRETGQADQERLLQRNVGANIDHAVFPSRHHPASWG
jgi:hypothetical protein